MLKAGALTYGMVVAILISLICGALLLFNGLHEQETTRLGLQDRLRQNARSGLEFMMVQPNLQPSGTLDLFALGNDSVILKHRAWGCFEFMVSKAIHSSLSHERMALTGYIPDENKNVALFLSDRNRPLKLCGPTELHGKCFLPKAGVERAYIEGQTYQGDRLVYGTRAESERQLPALEVEFLSRNRSYLNGITQPDDSLDFINTEGETVVHSHRLRTLVWQEKESIDLAGLKLKGNIIIQSSRSIYISATTQLEGVILYAPYIQVAEGFEGECQIIGSDSIHLETNVMLRYPSAVVCLQTEKLDPLPSIRLAENCVVNGPVIAWQEKATLRHNPYVQVAETAQINGQLYSKGMVELKGTVAGSVYCDRFILNTPSSVYENHLLGAIIDPEARSEYYAGCFLPGMSETRSIVKWLN